MACYAEYKEVVKQLLNDSSIDVSKTDNEGATPLYVACQGGNPRVVAVLLSKLTTEQINQPHKDGATPIWIACQNGHIPVVTLLLPKLSTEQINQPKRFGITPLWVACQNGRPEVVQLLLDHKHVQINKPNNQGATPWDVVYQQMSRTPDPDLWEKYNLLWELLRTKRAQFKYYPNTTQKPAKPQKKTK